METGDLPQEGNTVGYCIQRFACELWNCYRPFPMWAWACSFIRFFAVKLKVLSHGNLREMSLQDPRSTTSGWLTNTALSSRVLSSFIVGRSLFDYNSCNITTVV